MSQSSSQQKSHRAVIIQRGNELHEYARLLDDLAMPYDVWRENRLPTPPDLEGVSLVLVPGLRLTESGTPNLSLWPRTLAVIDGGSRTLVGHLNRIGVSMVVRRPIHRHTLRLLLLHEIYRGPERRKKRRTMIGHPIKAGGVFKQNATLLDLSPGGARLELANAPKVGEKLTLVLGRELTCGKPLKLKAQVSRCIRPSGQNGRAEAEIGVQLLQPQATARTVRAILDRFVKGPASWSGREEARARDEQAAQAGPAAEPSTREQTPRAEVPAPEDRTSKAAPVAADVAPSPEPEPEERPVSDETNRLPPTYRPPAGVSRFDPPPRTRPAPAAAAQTPPPTSSEATDASPSERRDSQRVDYTERVVALDRVAARVLVGRDLSLGGMRIDGNEAVEIGDTLRIALHCGVVSEPVVVLAVVDRDDGDHGTVLGFPELSDGQREGLEKIIASSSPIQAGPDDDPLAMSGSVVMGEVIETVSKGAGRTARPIETEDQIDEHLDALF